MRCRKAIAETKILLGLLGVLALPIVVQAQGAQGLPGIWVGQLKVQSQALTIVFAITATGDKLAATMDSPDQGAKGIPVSSISLEGSKLRLESAAIGGVFRGTLSADGKELKGSWSQGGASFPLAMAKKDAAPIINRPQEPKPPFPYITEEVSVENKKAGIRLGGTLVIPAQNANGSGAAAGAAASEGTFPALVFATGSGPQNRDEELLGHKPFLVLADYLARRGIASLRLDDRGVASSTGDFASATTLDFADDIEAGFEYLAARPEVKRGAVGILGHSEGGIVAPIVASRNAKVAFLVLLAGPGIRGDALLGLQGRLIARVSGASEKDIAAASEINARLYEIARAREGAPNDAAVKEELKKAYLEWLAKKPGLGQKERAQAEASVDQVVGALATPWFRTYLGLDPALYLAKVAVPVLALNGSKDLQVPSAENLGAIKAELGRAAGGPSPKDSFVELPGLNHLFQRAKNGSPDEYGKLEETIAPAAMKAVGDWILGL